MAYRIFVWLSAAVLAAGMWIVVLAGAGTAVASPESDSGSSASESSESSGSADAKADTDKPSPSASSSDDDPDEERPSDGPGDSSGTADSDPDDANADDTNDDAGEDVVDDADGPPVDDAEEIPVSSVERDDEADHQASSAAKVRSDADVARAPVQKSATDVDANEAELPTADPAKPAPEPVAIAIEEPAGESIAATDDELPEAEAAQPATKMFAFAASPNSLAAAANPPTVLDLVGTIFFNVFTVGFQLFQGPPQLPPGSKVTVHTSALELRPGYEVPADWYVPENADPDRLIYFQHGFITNSRSYSYTSAALAEQTNSIVVAPSITSNFLATDAFWLAGVPMQEAIANLFAGDREALTASASDALGHDVTLGRRVVLVGHSYGAQTLVGAASVMEPDTIAEVDGIVLLDGVSNDPDFAALNDLPSSLPVYNLSSPDSFFSGYGAVSKALANARPGAFNGFQLVGGSHVDTMQGGNQVIQFVAYLATGQSRPENIAAAKIVIAGWVNDMFEGTHDGVYGAPGTTIQIPTDAGTATATSVPVPSAPLGLLDQLMLAFGNFAVAQFFNFEPTEGPLVLF